MQGWCNGNTALSKSVVLGSNPSPCVLLLKYGAVGKWLSHQAFNLGIAGSNPVGTVILWVGSPIGVGSAL